MRVDIVTPGMPGSGAMTIVARTSGRRIGECGAGKVPKQ
jgi:hypothetical protein